MIIVAKVTHLIVQGTTACSLRQCYSEHTGCVPNHDIYPNTFLQFTLPLQVDSNRSGQFQPTITTHSLASSMIIPCQFKDPRNLSGNSHHLNLLQLNSTPSSPACKGLKASSQLITTLTYPSGDPRSATDSRAIKESSSRYRGNTSRPRLIRTKRTIMLVS